MRYKATIREARNGSWMLDTMVAGKRHRVRLGHGSKKWAQAEADRVLVERLNGGVVVPPVAKLETVVDAYKKYAESGQAKSGSLSQTTVTGCCSSFLLVARVGGGLSKESKLKHFTPLVVRNWHSEKFKKRMDGDDDEVEEARVLASLYSQWNQAKSLFGRRALSFYRDRGLTGLDDWANSMREVFLPRGEVPVYQLPPLELRMKTEVLGNKLKMERPNLWLIYKLAINCGLRAGEIAAMKRDWVEDYQNGKVVAVIRRPDFKPKGVPRRVPIDPVMWQEISKVIGDRIYVLPGSKTARNNLIRYDFSKWMNEIGWNEYSKCAHELRKLYGSRVYSELGAETARNNLGHTTLATTCRFYAALDKPMQLVAVR